MKNNLPILKFVLIASWLVSAAACESEGGQTNVVNTTNAVVKTSPTPLPTRKRPDNPKDPKEVCAYLAPELRSGGYSPSANDIYSCEAKKTVLFDSGKGAQLVYRVVGGADYVRTVEFHVVVDGTEAEKLKWEKQFVQTAEKLWSKTFAKPMPDEIKKQLEQDQGKPTSFVKKFEETNETEIRRDASGGGDHLLEIQFFVDKL